MLYNTISEDNLVLEQALHTSYQIEPVTNTYTREISGFRQEQQTTQYKATASLQGSYRYVGLTYGAALSAEKSLVQAYSHDTTRWSVGLSSNPETGEWGYMYLPTNNVPTQGARITPSHVDGDMWEVGVEVQADVTYYFFSVPTVSQVSNLLSAFASADGNLSAL